MKHNITFNKSGMYYNGIKVKEYSKSYILGFDKGDGIDKSCEIRGKHLNGVIIIDEVKYF